MPNIKSAKKRARQSEKRRVINNARKASIKTAVRKVREALHDSEDLGQVRILLREAESRIARARTKGVIHRNKAARTVSQLAKKVAQAEKAAK